MVTTRRAAEDPTSPEAVVVHVDIPEVDRATVEAFEAELAPAGPGGDVVVDLRDVSFIDSSGVRALVVARRATTASGGTFVIRNVGGSVQRVLDVLGARDLLEGRAG